ncbi:MAG: phage shock protein A [Candidatus Endobugula sp.]|jgi:phage shock protein A
MSILKNILTAFRGGVSEAGEAIVDANALRILEQEIRDADTAIQNATVSLTELKAKEIAFSKELSSLHADIDDYMQKAKRALSQGNEGLAREIAEKIAELTATKNDTQEQQTDLSEHVTKIHRVIKKRKSEIEKNRTELKKAKNYDDLQKTQRAVAAAMPSNDSSAKRVNRALERVKQKQANVENQMSADQWLAELDSGADLDNKINAAGLGTTNSSADDILAKLKAD